MTAPSAKTPPEIGRRRTTDGHSDLKMALAEQYVRDLVDQAPPLTEDQRARLRQLLSAPTAQGRLFEH